MNKEMKKNFISEIIGDSFKEWGHRKIILDAPTGSGKTTFILKKLLPYLQMRGGKRFRHGKKLLIVCNRRLLRKQYFYEITIMFDNYEEVQESVDVMTYQELAYIVQKSKSLLGFFQGYEVICLDEVHYFYQDSDFNGMGTFPLFRAIMLAGIEKQIIFISATIDCVESIIQKELRACQDYWVNKYLERGIIHDISNKKYTEILKPVSSLNSSYDYLQCICVPDQTTLCYRLAKSNGKSIIFIDDKKWADELYNDLLGTGEVKKNEICRINAENLDDAENNPVVKALALANRLIPKILITTSVLDNGVSIKDPEVENIIIFTESEISFKQMLGRMRVESINEKLNLYFMPRTADYFEGRERVWKKYVDKINEIKRRTLEKCIPEILTSLLSLDNEDKEIYEKIIIFYHHSLEVNQFPDWAKDISVFGDICLALNPFAVKKIGELYLKACKFHKLAREDEKKVIIEQMGWLGLSENDLLIEDSDYLKEREELLKRELQMVKDFGKKELIDFKERISNEFRKDLFPDIVLKKGSFSTEKLKEILERFGYELIETTGSNGNMKYSVYKQKKIIAQKYDISID